MAQLDIITLIAIRRGTRFFRSCSGVPLLLRSDDQSLGRQRRELCEAMLLSPHLSVSPYRPPTRTWRGGIQDYVFPNLLFAFKYIPMCLNGDDHKISQTGNRRICRGA